MPKTSSRPTPRIASLSLLVALAGCNVGPKYHVPVAAVAPALPGAVPVPYKEDSQWKTATPIDAIPRGAWWTIFHDAELDALEPQVEAANQTLRQADANLRAATAEIRVRKADRLPTFGVNPSYGGQRFSPNTSYFNPSAPLSANSSVQLPVEINYEVDLWGQVRRNIAAGKEEAQASFADRVNVLLTLQASVATAYFDLRLADSEQKLLDDTVAQYHDALRITTNRYNGGIAVKSDVTQAETQLYAAQVALSDIAIQRAQDEHAIAILTGKTPAGLTLPFLPLPVGTLPPLVPPGLPSELLERRPDVAAAERRAQEGNEAIGIAQAAFYPSIVLSGALGFQSNTAVQTVFSPASVVYSLGPGLAYTFFDGGRHRGLKEEAVAQFDRNAANYKQTVLTAIQQVEDNLAALRVLNEEAGQQHRATLSAQESERIFNNRYVGGVDTYLQVITAQTIALSNERNELAILRRRMEDTVQLVKALGGGWDRSQLPQQ